MPHRPVTRFRAAALTVVVPSTMFWLLVMAYLCWREFAVGMEHRVYTSDSSFTAAAHHEPRRHRREP